MKKDLDWALTVLKRPKKKRRTKKKAASKMKLGYRRKPVSAAQDALLKALDESA